MKFYPAHLIGGYPDARAAFCSVGAPQAEADKAIAHAAVRNNPEVVFPVKNRPYIFITVPVTDGGVTLWRGLTDHMEESEATVQAEIAAVGAEFPGVYAVFSWTPPATVQPAQEAP